jgi:hypothetical protein
MNPAIDEHIADVRQRVGIGPQRPVDKHGDQQTGSQRQPQQPYHRQPECQTGYPVPKVGQAPGIHDPGKVPFSRTRTTARQPHQTSDQEQHARRIEEQLPRERDPLRRHRFPDRQRRAVDRRVDAQQTDELAHRGGQRPRQLVCPRGQRFVPVQRDRLDQQDGRGDHRAAAQLPRPSARRRGPLQPQTGRQQNRDRGKRPRHQQHGRYQQSAAKSHHQP